MKITHFTSSRQNTITSALIQPVKHSVWMFVCFLTVKS